jgi:hypothetical protein
MANKYFFIENINYLITLYCNEIELIIESLCALKQPDESIV